MLFAKSSVCWNPIIYLVLNPQVMEELYKKRSVCGSGVAGATLARVVCSKHLFVHSFFYLQRVYQDILWYKVPQSTHIIEGKVVNFFLL